MMHPRRPAFLFFALSGVLASAVGSACDDGSEGAAVVVYTEVYIEPTSFRGEVPCSSLPGGMKSFVGTLTDVSASGADTDPKKRTGLPSSPPVSCATRAGFSSVADGSFYVGEVDGYDRDACGAAEGADDCILPLGGSGSGVRVMVDRSGNIVAPRWTTTCGDPAVPASLVPKAFDAPTQSLYHTAVPLRGCKPMTLGGGTTAPVASGLRLPADQILGSLTCGEAAGTVERIEASLDAVAGGASQTSEAACGQSLTFLDLSPSVTYVATVLGYEAGATAPRWGARCSATASGGLIVPAACQPLREDGTLLVSSAPLLESFAVACTPGGTAQVLARVEATLVGASRSTVGACAADLRFGALPTGSYTISVVGYLLDEQEGFRVLCHGDVSPGQETIATCDLP